MRRGDEGESLVVGGQGAADAPTLLLLHGFPSSSHMFRELIPLLDDEFHLIITQNGNAYTDGLSDGWARSRPTGRTRRPPTGKPSG